MKKDPLPVHRLADYQPYPFLVQQCNLDFHLDKKTTVVSAHLLCETVQENKDMVLNGENLVLKNIALDGRQLPRSQFTIHNNTLTIPNKLLRGKTTFVLETTVEIYPNENKALEGLYTSGDILCTQCEAEGFRCITYYPDRPDVMAVFRVRMQANCEHYPLLLGNGELVEQGVKGDEHYAVWFDSTPKPCYLFALVAGDLQTVEDSFTTMSGKTVILKIHSEAHNINKCDYAIESLKKAMRWDEDTYGREYELSLYQIVVVDDFNSGAMENKSLNIFNSECVLAHPQITTDDDYETIEAIVAHEYFHNWSGNRVTLRDWFQLCLKEGFTVFRESQFSADMRSAALKRIYDAMLITSQQFAEDSSPIAHPVRPDTYVEIRNFYTLTVYEKGAEVIGMLQTILGQHTFRKGCDHYFSQYDGCAVRVEEFVSSMEEVSGRSLQQFMLWYLQPGTPVIEVIDTYNCVNGRYDITFSQTIAPGKDKKNKKTMHIPIRFSLLDNRGNFLPVEPNGAHECVLELIERKQTLSYTFPRHPTPSLLRNFSAPVRIQYNYSDEQLAFLVEKDDDAYSRWSAGQELKKRIVNKLIHCVLQNDSLNAVDTDLAKLSAIYDKILNSFAHADSEKKALATTLLAMPTRSWLDEQQSFIHVHAIEKSLQHAYAFLAQQLADRWLALYQDSQQPGAYSPDLAQASLRKAKNLALSFLVKDSVQGQHLAWQQYQNADNMTDRRAAMEFLVLADNPEYDKQVIQDFFNRWSHEPLMLNQWLEVQSSLRGDRALDRIKQLIEHTAFDIHNPNKVYSVVATFSRRSYTGFHRTDALGYQWLRTILLRLDSFNSQIAARLATPLLRWKRYHRDYSRAMKKELKALRDAKISNDLAEVVNKSLN